MLVEMLGADSSRRDKALFALRSLLGKDGSQAAVGLLALLGVKQGGRSRHQGSQHERALAGIRGLFRRISSRSGGRFRRNGGLSRSRCRGRGRNGLGLLRTIGEAIIESAFRALLNALEADDAAGAVDLVGLTVDTGSLAVLVALATGDALALVDGYAEERKARDKTERGTHRADVVAPGASVSPGQIGNACQGEESHERHDPAVGVDDTGDDTPVSAVRRDEGDQDLDAKHEAEHENGPDTIPEQLMLGLVTEILADTAFKFGYGLARSLGLGGPACKAFHLKFPEGAAYPKDEVLVHAERADDGAVGASADKGQQHQRDYYCDVEGEAGGKELEFCHPAPPLLSDTDEEQGDTDEEYGRKRDSGFLQHIRLY